MRKVTFEILNSSWTQVNKFGAQFLNNELSFKDKKWGGRSIFGHAQQNSETIRMIEAFGDGVFMFPTGLLSRAITYCEKEKRPYKISNSSKGISINKPKLKGITFRDYQLDLINAFLEYGRGVIKAPTGAGKSIVIAGIVSAFNGKNILFLAHTIDLVSKMKDFLEEKLEEPVGAWTKDLKKIRRVTVGTVQSYVKVSKKYAKRWDVILVDEGHHISNPTGEYAKVLQRSSAISKGAFTATMPYLPKAKMALEAYIGPLIAEYTMDDANDDNILAKPNLILKPTAAIPYQLLLDPTGMPEKEKKYSTYEIVYWNGIVMNFNRNLDILQETYNMWKKGKSVLICVIRIPHGEELVRMLETLYPDITDFIFVSGKTVENRDKIIKKIEKKKIKVVIATAVFNEGIDITTLDTYINAAGGKSEIATQQKPGRALRKTKDKQVVTIIDYEDSFHPMTLKHFNLRYRMYKKFKWID